MTPADLGLTWKEFVSLIAACAFVWFELKAIRRDIGRLTKKVEQHNNFDRRIVRLETLLEAHHAEVREEK